MLAPLCPKPPSIPLEGTREYLPKVFELEPSNICSIHGEVVDLKCHTFLSIYIKSATFGRKFSDQKELCGGDKEADTKGPDADCVEHKTVTQKTRDACHGKSSCVVSVEPDMSQLGSACDGLKREFNLNFTCGNIPYFLRLFYSIFLSWLL